MRALFSLCISCITEENYWAEYHIGLFKSIEDVEAIIKRLMSDNGKFSKPDCKARISEVEIVGDCDNIECVYRFYGAAFDSSSEKDIVESPCYVYKSTAIEEFIKAKKEYPLAKQWFMKSHIVGECKY